MSDYNKTEKQFITFVERTVRGIQLDYFRRRTLKVSRETTIDNSRAVSVQQYFPDYITLQLLLDSCDLHTFHCLRSLSKKQIFILLRLLNGYTEKEIAAYLKISQQAVHSTKSRIKARLQRT